MVIVSGAARYVFSHPECDAPAICPLAKPPSQCCNVLSPNADSRLRTSSSRLSPQSAIPRGLHTTRLAHRYASLSTNLDLFLVGQLLIFSLFFVFQDGPVVESTSNSFQDTCSPLIFVAALTRHASSSTGTFRGRFFWQKFPNPTSATGSSPASLLDLSRFFFCN